MEIDTNAPGNVSQKGVTSGTDNETGFDSHYQDHKSHPVDVPEPAKKSELETHEIPPVNEDDDPASGGAI